ncbi:Zinc finger RING-CH-type [Penicillium chermesinum]|uniref:Zinc finger RING-CH-type n=1 Tax=Penicillium chermesinum TaxID=63820 RepID=A0A9W9NT70_9EURO|nr:Zinc finger RING-CH-type [Penicillium chermesinum]KAJ5225721.1 Zinc finger RING-CH-type [Penicillium chermesinum]
MRVTFDAVELRAELLLKGGESDTPSEFLQKARVVYESEDPDSGRLLRPANVKARLDMSMRDACRRGDMLTRGTYRLERLTWARWISSATSQIALTLAILLITIFLLGFIADPIIDLCLGPVADDIYLELEEDASWIEHFIKGFAALGFASFFKAIFTLSPLHWNIRGSGVVSNGRSTGRNRLASLNWLVILVGIGTFLWAVYKGVRSWCRRTLEKAGERVMDVPLPEDDDDIPKTTERAEGPRPKVE